MEFPACQKCTDRWIKDGADTEKPAMLGTLVPLSDYGQDGASVTYKAWVCTNPSCDFALRIDKGEISRGYKLHKDR